MANLTMAIESFDDSKFLKYLSKVYKSLLNMESFNQLPPKFSMAIDDLVETLNIKCYDG